MNEKRKQKKEWCEREVEKRGETGGELNRERVRKR